MLLINQLIKIEPTYSNNVTPLLQALPYHLPSPNKTFSLAPDFLLASPHPVISTLQFMSANSVVLAIPPACHAVSYLSALAGVPPSAWNDLSPLPGSFVSISGLSFGIIKYLRCLQVALTACEVVQYMGCSDACARPPFPLECRLLEDRHTV